MTAKKEKVLSAEEIKVLKENRELKKQIEELKKAQEQIESQSSVAKDSVQVANDEMIRQLQAQINLLSNQVKTGAAVPHKEKTLQDYFRPVLPEDVLPEEQEKTYIARRVMYMIFSYIDVNGVEKYPPHKPIIFQFAASDQRRDGKEWEIKNYCQYNTRLKSEIEYLDNHPLIGITFSSDLNAMRDENIRDTDFKVLAAGAVGSLPPEEIIRRARQMGIDDPRKSPGEMKILIINKMAEEYKRAASEQAADKLKRSLMAMLKKQEEKV